MRETQSSIYRWQVETFPKCNRAGQEGKLFEEIEELKSELMFAPHQAGPEMADVVIVLYGLACMMGIDLHQEIDYKMEINRSREWEIQPDGTGKMSETVDKTSNVTELNIKRVENGWILKYKYFNPNNFCCLERTMVYDNDDPMYDFLNSEISWRDFEG